MRSRPVVVFGLAVLVVLAGCGGAQVSGGGGSAPEATAAASGEGAGGSGGGGGGGDAAGKSVSRDASGEATSLSANRVRIRTGRVVLEVQNYDAARANLTAATRAHGGYVSGSNENLHRDGNATWTTGTVVLRVPKENFTEVFARVKARGTVLESNTQVKDVTDQLLDINARLKNLRAQRERLRTLYQQANDTEAVLKVSQRLSEVQSEIERLKAQKRSLKNRVAYATITVQLREPEPEEEEVDRKAWYEIGVITAFLESVSGVITVLRAMVVLAAYVAPYVLVFGSPLFLGGLFYWYRSR